MKEMDNCMNVIIKLSVIEIDYYWYFNVGMTMAYIYACFVYLF